MKIHRLEQPQIADTSISIKLHLSFLSVFAKFVLSKSLRLSLDGA